MADKKKKQTSKGKKQTSKESKFKYVEDMKNPKLPKENKIPKGVDRTLISKEGNIIMTVTNTGFTDKKRKTTSKKSADKKPTAKATPKSAVKSTKSANPKTAPKQTKKSTKKAETAKTTKRVKALMPDWKYENETGADEKIIVINGKKSQNKPKSGRRKLKRVANIGGYTAWDGRTGKTFATEKEAREYAVDFFARTGEIIAITHTQRTVSHTFKAENKTDK